MVEKCIRSKINYKYLVDRITEISKYEIIFLDKNLLILINHW